MKHKIKLNKLFLYIYIYIKELLRLQQNVIKRTRNFKIKLEKKFPYR